MNRRVRLRPQRSGLIYYYKDTKPEESLRWYAPDYTFTRIWMGIAPGGVNTPGYCCIVGEKFDPDALWQNFVLLDEAASLQPTIFTPQERAQFNITVAAARSPTLEGLRRVAVCLKDLYEPSLCWCVPVPPFVQFLRQGEGLSRYDESSWHLWKERWPFIKVSNPHTVPIVGDDEGMPCEAGEIGIGAIDSLFAKDRMEIVSYYIYDDDGNPTVAPSLFMERRAQWPAIYRALSWVIVNMLENPVANRRPA